MEHAYLTYNLSYDQNTGYFTWSQPRSKIKVGDVAGHTHKNTGYVSIEIDGKIYAAHRLAWFYVTGKMPELQIDHINRIKNDNRFENLREASNGQNRANTKSSSKHGLKGVSYKKWLKEKPWEARITFEKKVRSLGCFSTKEEAHEAYCKEAKRLHGDFFNP
jgi:hypothetical protein